MKKISSMSKDGSNLSKSHFGYFRHSLVNFKNLIILFWNIWACIVHEKVKRDVVFDLEHIKNDSLFVILNHLIRSLLVLLMFSLPI